ncbi:MAG: hypothetical protein AAFX03_06925 [Pseudomonadota bacterium]
MGRTAMSAQRMKRAWAAGLAAALIFAAGAAAQDGEVGEDRRADFEQRMAEFSERLDLTDAQKAELEPIMAENFQQRRALLESYGFTEEGAPSLSRRTLRKLRGEAKEISDETLEKAAEVLSED